MGSNGNGDKKLLFVGSIIAGCIGVVLVIYNVVFAPLSNAIGQEAHARITGDNDIRNEVNGKLDKLIDITTKNGEVLASYKTIVDINTRRIDTLESRGR